MKYDVLNLQGDTKEAYDLPDYIFDVEINKDLVHQALRAMVLNRLHPVAHTKDRSERRGGGRKPWKQKGTGRARHGSTRSPIWRKGGVTFGPSKDANPGVSINKKMKRKALFMALSSIVKGQTLYLVDEIDMNEFKTRKAQEFLQNLVKSTDKKTLIVLPKRNMFVEKSFANLSNVSILLADSLNVEELMKCDIMVTSVPSIDVIKETYKV